MDADTVVESLVKHLAGFSAELARDIVDQHPHAVEWVQYNYCVNNETAVEIVRRVSELARCEGKQP